MIPSTKLKVELTRIARDYINVLSIGPRIEFRPGALPPHKQIHFIYPLSHIAGNAADSSSLVAMQSALSVALNRHVGTMWVGVFKDQFHIWAAYKDTPRYDS